MSSLSPCYSFGTRLAAPQVQALLGRISVLPDCPQELRALSSVRSLSQSSNELLCAGVFQQFQQEAICGFSLDQMIQHSLEVGQIARQFARAIMGDELLAADALLAGLLHDVGKLVLASSRGVPYADVLRLAHESNLTLWHAEQQVLGATHAEVGSYLLHTWGLPESVVEAVAFHHEPSALQNKRFTSVTAVHVANGLLHERIPKWLQGTSGRIDHAYLTSLDQFSKIDAWIKDETNIEAELIES